MYKEKFYVGESGIHGRGLFAVQFLKKGEIVFVMKGKMISKVEKTKEDAMENPDRVGVSKNLWIDPKPPRKFINHSCNPNLGMRGRFLFVALRNIKKGEELTFDYSISEDSAWEMKCRCGEKNCRKKITGIRSLPLAVYKKYLPCVPKYFQKIYRESAQI